MIQLKNQGPSLYGANRGVIKIRPRIGRRGGGGSLSAQFSGQGCRILPGDPDSKPRVEV